MRNFLLCVAVLLCGGVAARAATINFESVPAGSHTSYTEQGVTFTTVDATTFSAVPDPNGTLGLLSDNSPRPLLRADIAGGTNSVSVDLGDFDADDDLLRLEVFNASNVSLGFTSLAIPASDSSMHTLTLAVPGIAYAIFGSSAPSVNGSSVYADNFTFNAAAVPVPGSAIAGLVLLAILPLLRRLATRA